MFFALYFVSLSSGLQSISRPGRTNAYSPARRKMKTAANSRKLELMASARKPKIIRIGTIVSRVVTPKRCAIRPVKNTCVSTVRLCTIQSMRANTCVLSAATLNVAATICSCSKYRVVLTAEIPTMNSAMPSR